MALKNVERPDSAWSYCLDRLFDPEDLYYTPMDELLKRYKKRNLFPGRMFNLAKKYGNVIEKRRRIIHAPQMERAGQRIFGTENFYYPPPKVYYCNRPEETKQKGYSSASEDDNEDEKENVDYNKWLEDRRILRDGLNKLDLNPEYLKNKKNLSEVERRVLRNMIHVDKEIQTDPIKEKRSNNKKSPRPAVVYPTPLAMKNIEEFLSMNKWRLVDLFKDLDKNKDWNVKKDDFIRECKKGRLEISDNMIDELITALHNPKTDFLNYKELAKGRSSHLSDRRNEHKDSLNSHRSLTESKKDLTMRNIHQTKSTSSIQSNTKSDYKSYKTESEENDSRLSNYLHLPKIDSSVEYYPPIAVGKKTTERSVSATSSKSFSKRTNSELSTKPEISETKKSIEELRHKSIKEYVDCLKRTQSLNFKTKSSLLNGLVPPTDQSSEELVRILKAKTDEKKFLIKQAEKEAKLRNRRKKLINQI